MFKRPFVIDGMDYVDTLRKDFGDLEKEFSSNYYSEYQ